MAAHAILSPSSAHRWLHCTAAPRLEENIQDQGSDFAAEGTLAHAYCALKLKTFLNQSTDGENADIILLADKYHTGEMDEYTDTYKTIVLEKFNEARAKTRDALLLVETRLDFSKYIPKSFGTGDAVIIADGTMEIIDFKYGKGVKVFADHNPQMMIYALGAYERFSFDYNIKRVRMTIIQPRIDNLSEFELPVRDLLDWAHNELEPKAEEAFSGNGHQEPGEWCRFCKVKNQCKALSEHCTKTVQSNKDPKLISNEDLAKKVLPLLPMIKTWLDGVEDYALQQALEGAELPGWKIVRGRSNRKITDPDNAIKALTEAGYTQDTILKPAELRGLTDLEKLVGKKKFAVLCGEYITKPEGKPTLAAEDDNRPAINPVADDFKDINF